MISRQFQFMLITAISWLILISFATAQSRLIIEVGKGKQLKNVQHAESIFVADPDIADIRSSPGEASFIYGKSPGETTIIASDAAGNTLFIYDLVVIHNLREIQNSLSKRFPKAELSLNSARGSVQISGVVPDGLTHQNVLTSLKASLPNNALIDEIIIAQSKIIQFELQFLEVAKDQIEKYGIDWSILTNVRYSPSTDPIKVAFDVAKTISLLLNNGVATVASETTLTTINKKRADFSVGEQIAIPTTNIANGSSIVNSGVDFKFVGTNVSFLPMILPGGKVNLEITSDVSSIQNQNRIINGNSFPNLVTRKFSTYIELNSGESFIVAGLSHFETDADLRKPYKIIRNDLTQALFGRSQINARNRDLIAVVTPHFNDDDKLKINNAIIKPTSNIEYYIMQSNIKKHKKMPKNFKIYGPAGFMY